MIQLICVGLGGMGHHDWTSALAVPGVVAVGGVDVNTEAAAAFHEQTGAPIFGSLTEAIAGTKATAALIAVPDKFHAPLAIEALSAGLDVICEKPLAENLADATRMHETARHHGKLLIVHQQLRWAPGMYEARQLIHKGAIGEVRSLEFEMTVFSNAPLGGYRSKLEFLALQDLGIHHFDLIRYLSGEEGESVYARCWKPREAAVDVPAPTTTYALLEMTRGVHARYTCKLRALTGQTGYYCLATVTGSEGELIVGEKQLTLQTHQRHAEGLPPEVIEATPPKVGAWESFARSIETREPTLTDSGENLKSLAILFAAIESARDGRVVSIP